MANHTPSFSACSDSVQDADQQERRINVIIPVYRGVRETGRCIESVVASGLPENASVTIIDDASPEQGMLTLLEDYSRQHRITLLHNPVNLGFVATVNRGMSIHPDADVVLLNSDTEVPAGWLERLRRSAYAGPRVGTATPFSNNATICSYPKFCADNLMPGGYSVETLDALFKYANAGQIVDIPTAVGFCMYIRRDCLNETGQFDEKRFGKGYGEENDFCLRATAKGWRHTLCADLFVYHAGSVSFANERDERTQEARNLIAQRYPRYQSLIQKHISKDPARYLRHRVDLLRLTANEKPVILLISHRLGGGVLKHEQELSRLFAEKVNFLRLIPGTNGQVEISWFKDGESLKLCFHLPNDWQEMVDFLKLAQVARIHFHHLMDMPSEIEGLPSVLGVAYDFTVHDYFLICPKITLTNAGNSYCGEPAEDGCSVCLRRAPKHQRDIRAWRSHHGRLLAGAERVFVPSHDVASRLGRYFQLANLIVSPHADMRGRQVLSRNPPILQSDERMRIIIIGALSAPKGADLLEAAALDAKKRGLPLEFHLVGYAWRRLATRPKSLLTVSGPYRDEDLPGLLDNAKPHLIWFPALLPETYSYTLSAALNSGLPVVAPNLGVFPERLADRAWSWICSWNRSAQAWNNFFVHLRKAHFLTAIPPPPTGSGKAVGINVDWVSIYLNFDKAHSKTPNRDAILRFADTFSRTRLPLIKRILIDSRAILLRLGLVILRLLPLLSRLMRHMPPHWQRRLRHWLT